MERQWAEKATTETLKAREEDLAAEVKDSEYLLGVPGSYVNRRALAADRRLLKVVRSELARRNK